MKKIKIIGIIMVMLLLFVGCIDDKSRHKVYLMGYEHNFDTINVKVENDEEQERFVIYYDILNEGEENQTIYFQYSCNTIPLTNSDQFEYSDNLGSVITFDEDGYYTFTTSRIFYMSYKNAEQKIKDEIKNKEYTLCFSMATFAPVMFRQQQE